MKLSKIYPVIPMISLSQITLLVFLLCLFILWLNSLHRYITIYITYLCIFLDLPPFCGDLGLLDHRENTHFLFYNLK